MTPNTRKLLIKLQVVLLFLIFVLNSYAQSNFKPGYYVTFSNDTIWGLIDNKGEKSNSKSCIFKENDISETKRFGPSEIKSYRFIDNKYYISKKIKISGVEKTVFLEYLLNGIVNLYFYRDLNNYLYFIESEDGRFHELTNKPTNEEDATSTYSQKSNKYIGVLKALLSDCNQIQNDLNNVSLGHSSLIDITKEYHDYMCDDEDCIIYVKVATKLKLRIAPIIGGGTAKLQFDKGEFSNYEFENNTFPLIGVLLNFSFPKWNKKLSLNVELDFYKTVNKGAYINEQSFKIDYYNSSISITSFQPSVALKYTFQKGKIKPTIAAGIYSNFFISKDETVTKRSVQGDIEGIYELQGSPLASDIFGILLQVGCNYQLNNHTFFTNLRICQTALKEAGISTSLNTFNFGIGMYLQKDKK